MSLFYLKYLLKIQLYNIKNKELLEIFNFLIKEVFKFLSIIKFILF